MILLFVGNPGSGKSYEAITKIVSNLAQGREVFTNIDGLDKSDCRHVIQELSDLDDYTFEHSLHHLSKEEVPHFYEIITPNSLVVIDECHKFWNSRDFQKADNRSLADWAAEHRHHGNDVVFLTQKPAKLDSQVRSLAEWTHEFRKLNMFGRLTRNGYQCFIYEGEMDGQKPLSTQFRKYNEKFFRAYKSHINDDIKELGVTKAPNILNHWSIYAMVLSVIICGYFFSKSSFSSGKAIDYEIAKKPGITPGNKRTPGTVESITNDASSNRINVREGTRQHRISTEQGSNSIHTNTRTVSSQAGSNKHSPLKDVDDQLVWFPVSAYMSVKGKEYIMIGNHKLESWIDLTGDKRYVQIDKYTIPEPVLHDLSIATLWK